MPSKPNWTKLPSSTTRQDLLFRIALLVRNIAIGGSIASWFASLHWIPDLLSHLRVQYAIVLLPCIAMEEMRRKRLNAVLVCGLFLYNAWPTIPYLFPARQSAGAASGDGKLYRILSFNVLRTNEQLELTLNQIMAEDPDFVFLMEVQNGWNSYFESVKNRYPHQKILTDPAYTGVAFLSKHPWLKLEVITLGVVNNPSIDVRIPRLDATSETFRIIATHPLPPLGGKLTESRDQQLRQLAKRFLPNEPNLMIGDLNLTPWSPRFSALLKAADLVDASLGKGISPTLAPLPTWFGGVKVDHVLTGGPIQIKEFRIEPAAYSDHEMVIADFVVRK